MNILLLDDDSTIIKSLLPVLKGIDGHEVRVSTTPEKAFEHAEALGNVDLLITGVVMEPEDGFSFRDRLRDRFPALRTLFVTGYDLSDYPSQTKGYRVLEKPVDPDAFREAVRKELAAAEAMRGRDEMPAEPGEAESKEVERATEAEKPAEPPSPTAAPVPLPAAGPGQPKATPTPPSKPMFPPPPSGGQPPRVQHAQEVRQPTVQTQAPVARQPSAVPTKATAPGGPPPAAAPPLATPSAVPKGAVPAVPTATPRPTAPMQPKATPSATPKAVPQPRPAPTATPKPAATPQATPKATPSAVTPRPAPTATPRSIPTAIPKAATPSGVPKAAPRVSVAPAGGPKVAVPAARPVAAPAAVPKVAAAPTVAPSASDADADSLEGRQLGPYKILRKVMEGEWGPVYEAEQVTMGRLVALKVLSQKLQADPESKKKFIANASAKANVQHPVILSVYEAGEADGHCYFTHEHVDGEHLQARAARGETIGEPSALLAIRVAAEGLGFMNQHKIPHASLQPNCIFIGSDQRPRLANMATWQDDEHPETQQEIQKLAGMIASVLPGGEAPSPGMQALLEKMRAGGESGFLSWPALLQAVKALEPKVIPADAFKLSAQDEAAIRAVETEKKHQKRSIILSVVGMSLLVMVTLFVLWFQFIRTNERIGDEMVRIPAGEFIYQDGQIETLPSFHIDQYEVTIGQYARFVEYLKGTEDAEGNMTTEFDHPDQPPNDSHIPKDWDKWYGRAKVGKPAKFVPVDLNCPIFNVDWWDAYAYAKWKGRRLPTEKEWEKAARGTKGLKYPWGNEFDPKKVNSVLDYIYRPGPNAEAKVDGYFWFSPVDMVKGDKSPYGVIGMAGNLNEWTGTWEETAQGKFPVIRGGSYRSAKEDGSPNVETTFRFVGLDAERQEEFLGFRTATDEVQE